MQKSNGLAEKTLIAFATRWSPQFGGINSFNHDLLEAFAAALARQARIICVVLHATEEEIQNAQDKQVELVSLQQPDQKVFSATWEANVWQALSLRLQISENRADVVWLGHDRITGEIAITAAKTRGGKSALIHHMSYSHYESFAENSQIADQKTSEQRRLFAQADIALAVGPLLQDALSDMLDRENVPALIPGLPDIPVKTVNKGFKVFISGRLSADAKKIKQGYLGVAAFSSAVKQADQNNGLPQRLRGVAEPELTLRGVDFEETNSASYADAEKDLKTFSEQYADRVLRINALPFTTNRQELFDNMRSASVAMMPSWHEGFGLVGWEAIAAGVPLILSKKSGLYKLIEQFDCGTLTSLVYGIDIAGSHTEPFFSPKDCDALALKLIEIANSLDARQKASRLRETLAAHFTWANCARELAQALDWPIAELAQPMPHITATLPQIAAAETPILEMPRPTWQAHLGLSHSWLLRAEEAVIDFAEDRLPFLAEQTDWALNTDYPIATRLLTGVGGVGKTRLALELCEQLQNIGWFTGFLPNEADIPAVVTALEQQQQQQQHSQNVLVVIDYAETRQAQLLTLLKKLLSATMPRPVRILLLARDSGEWWHNLPTKDPACEALLEGTATSGPFRLPNLHDDIASRHHAYQLAIRAFAGKLAIPPSIGKPNLDDDHFAHPLYVQMAALLSLYGEMPGSAEAVARALIRHEQRYWGKALSSLPGTTEQHTRSATLLMTLSTMTNGLSTAKDCEALWKALGEDTTNLKRLFLTLSQLYPGRQGVQGLRPDLLGEELVAQSILSVEGDLLLDTLLGHKDALWRISSLTVLARLLRNREDVSGPIENALVRNFNTCAVDVLDVIIRTPSPLPGILERAFLRLPMPQKTQACGILDGHLQEEIIPLIDLTVQVRHTLQEKLAKKANKSPAEKASLAIAYGQFSVSLAWQGSFAKGIQFGKMALDIHQTLAKTNPKQFEPGLATSLSNVAEFLSDLGRSDEALIIAKQALDIRARLASAKPEEFEPAWARSLCNFANHLSDVGRNDEALTMAKQALEILGKLASTKPEEFEPARAISLINYANRLSDVGHIDQALTMDKQALDILQRLARTKPERFEPDWGTVLTNYAIHLSNVGRSDEALNAAKQALDILKKLAAAKPERFEPDWAKSLSNYASHLSNVGRSDEALNAAKQALVIHEKLAAARPHVHNFQREISVTQVDFLSWLANKAGSTSSPLPIAELSNPRQRYFAEFYRAFVIALTSPDFATRIAAAEQTQTLWRLLDIAQKIGNTDHQLLLLGLAEHLGLNGIDYTSWRAELERFRNQRHGRLPWWMTEAARRAGFNL